jgi:hypothetical protein
LLSDDIEVDTDIANVPPAEHPGVWMIREGDTRRHPPFKIVLMAAVSVVVITAVVSSTEGSAQTAQAGADSRLDCSGLTGHAGDLDAAQERNAKIITAVAHARGLGDNGAAIGVAAALAESTLYNFANDGSSMEYDALQGRRLTDNERAVARQSMAYPHDEVGNNLDSVGLFQQRPMTGWGPPQTLMDPVLSTGLFFDHLVQVPHWDIVPAWDAAQSVQASPSADGDAYRNSFPLAVDIVAALTAGPSAPDAATEVAIDGHCA